MDKGKLRRFQHLLEGQLSLLEEQTTGAVSGMVGAEEAAVRPDPNDRATVEADRNFDLRLRDRDRRLIAKIKEALVRIEAGTYGRCDDCGATIGEKRLSARPVTTQCVACKEEEEKLEKRAKR